jgi:hypothetical protein
MNFWEFASTCPVAAFLIVSTIGFFGSWAIVNTVNCIADAISERKDNDKKAGD